MNHFVSEGVEVLNVYEAAKQVDAYVIQLRRHFHKYPELSLQEEKTMEIVKKELTTMNIPYEYVPNGGVLGFISGKETGKTLILRADLDALPMKEEANNLKEKKHVVSEDDSAAHTCGHDGHTAMLLGAAQILSENKHLIKGKIILAFEQGEEVGGGIFQLLTRLCEIGADGVWGIHLKSDLSSGKISVDAGARMASIFPFEVKITGKSGHGSRPDLSQSPIDCFTDFYQHLKSMRLNVLDPFKTITYSLGSVTSGSAANVIPDTLTFSGTCRYLNYEIGKQAEKEFKRILKHMCELHDCQFEFVKEPIANDMVVMNSTECAQVAQDAVVASIGESALASHPAWMASETFGMYQQYFPGVFAFVGTENEEKGTGADHHNGKFDIDESVLKVGVAATVQYALDFLSLEDKIPFKPEEQTVQEKFIALKRL